jgi:hypothetical protein
LKKHDAERSRREKLRSFLSALPDYLNVATEGAPVKHMTITFCSEHGFSVVYDAREVPFEMRVLMAATIGIPATDDKPS